MDNCSSTIEETAASLVREYLSRKGLKGTLAKMDEEMPRSEKSISNRQALMKHLHLEKLMKKNKEQPEPLKAMLEIMSRYFIERRSPAVGNQGGSHTPDADASSGFSSSISFSPQATVTTDNFALKPVNRPATAVLSTRKEKSSELVMDEDVQGETLMGTGKSGLLSNDLIDPTPQFATRTQPPRSLSAKQRTSASTIMSNDDTLSMKRRGQLYKKPSNFPRLSVSEQMQQQQRKNFSLSVEEPTEQPNGNSALYSDNSKNSSGAGGVVPSFLSVSGDGLGQKEAEAKPSSFEALIMKGEERANLLQKIGLEKRAPDPVDGSYSVEDSSMGTERSSQFKGRGKHKDSAVSSTSTKVDDLEFGDVDDLETEVGGLELQNSTPLLPKPSVIQKIQSTPIDLKTAIALKNIVLGSPNDQYSDEWLLQGLSFCDMPDLKYGIVQKKGGPCGVLAAVQASLIQELKFGDQKLLDARFKNPTRQERSQFLARALSNIFWRAGEKTRAVVTIPSQTKHLLSSTKFKQDDVTETLSLYTFTSFDELCSFLTQSISQFENDGSPGVILVMYSVILSRKSHLVRGDFDTAEGKMIAAHGYCTQELVNLLLTGRAVSNVFNDVVQLDSGGIGDTITLKGISGRSEIGLLSLFEHYKSCQVGTYYKTPKFPIWLVCSESHFSVLFSTRRDLVSDWKAEKRFDLIYYDGLSRQQEEIKLTISTLNKFYKPPSSEEDLVPPLEHCIRTKWSEAEIDWNGYEPIL